jgi:cob(I)alamin adenosyltransferase
MGSIATTRGDRGLTGLAGGLRVSKASLRVESYGVIDELNSALGLARATCADADLKQRTKHIQRDLFRVSATLATAPECRLGAGPVTEAMVGELTRQVHELESAEGLLADWSVPGEEVAAAAYDLARTICRRAERAIVRLKDSGEEVESAVLAYVNRLSDLLWLYARKVEAAAGAGSPLRDAAAPGGPRWSRAW